MLIGEEFLFTDRDLTQAEHRMRVLGGAGLG